MLGCGGLTLGGEGVTWGLTGVTWAERFEVLGLGCKACCR